VHGSRWPGPAAGPGCNSAGRPCRPESQLMYPVGSANAVATHAADARIDRRFISALHSCATTSTVACGVADQASPNSPTPDPSSSAGGSLGASRVARLRSRCGQSCSSAPPVSSTASSRRASARLGNRSPFSILQINAALSWVRRPSAAQPPSLTQIESSETRARAADQNRPSRRGPEEVTIVINDHRRQACLTGLDVLAFRWGRCWSCRRPTPATVAG
jgi:hypothetical protein